MTRSWTPGRWAELDARVRRRAERAATDDDAIAGIRRASRAILHDFSGSFFLVTRFLPPPKRAAVEMIYAAARYPDEIVDTFQVAPADKQEMLDDWQRRHDESLAIDGVRARLAAGIPWILAGFAEVARQASIPPRHYRAFLDAMRRDISPRGFATLDDLILNYVYGSAIVVGYFLAHVYGTAPGVSLDRAYRCAADLGVALQLTNFARDVAEDLARGRVYVPRDVIASRGLRGGPRYLAAEAEDRYARVARDLHVFAPDCRAAVRACIDVYRLLNRRILDSTDLDIRHSVPLSLKFRALPPSKYWRVPLAYMGAL